MTVWQDLPSSLRDGGALDALRDPLSAVNLTPEVVTTEDGRTWRTRSAVVDLSALTGGAIDPATGRVGAGGETPIEFASSTLTLSLGERDDGGGAGGSDAWRVDLDVPGIRVRLPFLTGARLAADGMLEPDPGRVVVRLLVPRLVMRLSQLDGAATAFELRSATTSGQPLDDVYSAVEMSPPYAFVGPGAAVGFAFRAAVLDLSGTNGPVGVPAGARAMPGTWQGFYLPEARLFVAPDGLEGIAVSAGVRNLWIGLGAHAGVTGTFSAEVVNRGRAPTVVGRFITPAGRHVAAVENGDVAVPDGSTFLADGAGGTAPVRLSIAVDGGASVASDRTVVSVPATSSASIVVTATSGGGQVTVARFGATRLAEPAGGGAGANPATWTLVNTAVGAVVEVSQTATSLTLRLEPRRTATWTWPGGGSTGEEATIPAAAGADLEVTALPDGLPTPLALEPHLRYNHPFPSEATTAWSLVESNIRMVAATSTTAAPTGESLVDVLANPATRASYANLDVRVDGYASFEPEPGHPTDCIAGHTSCDRNESLSERRANAVRDVLVAAGIPAARITVAWHGHTPARLGNPVLSGSLVPPPADGRWWAARVTATPVVVTPVGIRVRRNPIVPTTQRDPAPPASGRPDCFRRIGVEVEILRSTFIRCEVWGEFDIQTALETSLQEGGSPPLGGRPSEMDGVCLFRVRLRVASDGGAWEVFGEFRAATGDLDGLLERRADTADDTALNMAGAFAVMGPISAAVATLSPEAGALVQLGSIALGATGLLTTKVLTLHGGELVVSNGIIAPDGSTASTASGAAAVMVDVEVQFTFNLLNFIWVPPDKPIRTRYKAVGIRAGWSETGPALPIPIFDPSRGYELDIQPGSLQAVPPLDEILRIFGVRVSRDNPTYLEVEAGIGVELGPVTIDTVRVRMRLDQAEVPQLTKLGASIDIPSTVHGSGVLEFTPAGFKAAFDITIVPLKIRATAVLAVETIDGVTGILIGIEVEFPVPLLLGGSGLGIFGLMGGVGINYARRENPNATLPALDWVTKQLSPPRKSVMHPDGWVHQAGSYAFAGGLLLGTAEGGFVIHLKGIILIEVPGPRLLLVMKADVLKMPPTLVGEQSATFLAVLDIDFGRGTITLGVVADYKIDSILSIHVPVTAFFSTNEPETWRVDLGTYEDRITVKVLDVLEASGYLMVHGDGITIPVLPPAYGLSIATGFHLQVLLMGSKAARLYVEVAAGFDAVLGFDPFFLAGTIYIRGELMLFIVSIGVSAKLDLAVGKREENGVWVDHPYVHGQVCGKVSFFFFDIEACLELTIGSPPAPDLQPRPLVEGLTLIGRSPALVEGSGTGHQMDASLGEARELGVEPLAAVPVVPIDAIPVLTFSATPEATGLSVMGETPEGISGVEGDSAWQRIGERWWAYKITAIRLDGALIGTVTPSAWWNDATPTAQRTVPSLALLTWLPTPFSRAIAFGETLTTSVEHRWGTACDPPVPAQPQLWTFGEQPLGPSAHGWRLPGVVWRDPAGLPRSAPARRWLRVREPWRTGDAVADSLAGVEPARVLGDLVLCDTGKPADGAEPLGSWVTGITKVPSQANPAPTFGHAVQLLVGGELGDLQQAAHDAAADPDDARGDLCPGRLLRAPWRESKDTQALLLSEREQQALQAARDAVGHRPDELGDAVVLDAQEELVSARLLLVATLERTRPLLVVARDAAGTDLGVIEVDNGMRVSGGNPLPSTWVDVDGPWARPVTLAGRAAAGVIRGGRLQGLFLVDLRELDPRTTTLAIGWRGTGAQEWEQPVHVVAIEALTAAEVRRSDWDTTVATKDREALESGLTNDPDECALLTPGAPYSVAVTWEWDSEEGEEKPTRLPAYAGATTQTFTFAAHPATESPRDLRPWLLDTDPGMGDTGLLRSEPVRVALAHQRVPALFEAYGRRLEVTVLAASGHHPRPPGGGAPGAPLVIPVRQVDDVLGVVRVIRDLPILAPWDEAASAVAAGLPCVAADHVVRTGSEITVGYDLDPLTDYLLDVHSVPLSGTGVRHRVFRANFTTSRFTDLAHLASWILPTVPEHRLVRDRAPLDALGFRPGGNAWDDAVQRAGLPVPAVPSAPRVEIWWSAEAVPQPVAVVVECSESLLRERTTPVVCRPPGDTSDPTHTWWGTGLRPWLELAARATPDAGDATPSGPLVVGPGGTRALVRLAPGARGRRLRLDLVRHPDLLGGAAGSRELAVDVLLARAPWEVED